MLSKAQQAVIDNQLKFRPKIVEASDAPVLDESWLLEEDSQVVTVEVQLISSKTLKLETRKVGIVRGLTLLQNAAIPRDAGAASDRPTCADTGLRADILRAGHFREAPRCAATCNDCPSDCGSRHRTEDFFLWQAGRFCSH